MMENIVEWAGILGGLLRLLELMLEALNKWFDEEGKHGRGPSGGKAIPC